MRVQDVWPDSDADGLREYVRKEWPQLAEALDEYCDIQLTLARTLKRMKKYDES